MLCTSVSILFAKKICLMSQLGTLVYCLEQKYLDPSKSTNPLTHLLTVTVRPGQRQFVAGGVNPISPSPRGRGKRLFKFGVLPCTL